MNKYKNEALIKVGEVEILLRPDFENLSAFESSVMTMDQFAFNLSKARTPSMSQLVQTLFYFQAARKPDGTRLLNLEEINLLVMNHGGIALQVPIMGFLARCVSGSATGVDQAVDKAVSESEKKS